MSEHLTPRQTEVARLVARGWTDKRIAAELGIAENTVGHHVTRAARGILGPERPRRKLALWVVNVSGDS